MKAGAIKVIGRCCGNCSYWEPAAGDVVGLCRDAMKRAREVVPFAVNLDVSPTYSHGGKDCPCFAVKSRERSV